MMRRFISRMILLLFFAAYLWAMGFLWFVSEIPREEIASDLPADAAVVLTGGTLRLEHGLDLLARGVVKKLFISGVAKGASLTDVLHGASYQLQREDYPLEKVIILGYDASDTQGNAEETARWTEQDGVRSLRLVTSNYHMPRAVSELRAIVPDVDIIPDPVLPEHFRRDDWWRYPGTLKLMLSEYHKYLTRRLQYALHIEGMRLKPIATTQ